MPREIAKLFDLSDRVALVTGAASGLGARFAETLARSGAKVVCAARRRERVETLAEKINHEGGTALALELDVTDVAAAKEAFDEIEEQLGIVSILVNNAGADSGDPIPFDEMLEENWDRLMAVNLKAVYQLGQLAAKRLIAAKQSGSIVNIASVMAHNAGFGLTDYCVSKAGCVQLTRNMALDLARYNIRVNAIAPGLFFTEMTEWAEGEMGELAIANIPMGRGAKTEEMDGTLLLLASDASSFITGTVITVDGGQSAHLAGA